MTVENRNHTAKQMTTRIIQGVGINDADYTSSKCPYYKKWYGIIIRCYDKSYQKRKPSYVGATVCDEWLIFSNFRDWCIEQEEEVGDISKLELDKDLLSTDSNHYSPSTCCFLPKKVNMFIQTKSHGKHLMGVCRKKKRYRYSCRDTLSGKRIQSNSFTTELEAFQGYIEKKNEIAHEIAYETDLVPQPHVKEALCNYYPNLYNQTIH
ncbi:hypothetical protein FA893_18015 [Photobacterium damselae subsp. piscicida]|uniref:hypothetical protein n=1 Tax=Photobacterium damselae TaxID=38293 RepID=UPI00030FBCB0|nr:hypothetical protein [Photobacterium damselae]OLQ82805.1 hypothetical protein BEI67_06190 [Photobacterium damselae subsp. piscicida]TFZ54093.1 hypothetical protein E4T25_15445 [Photobacterium damselae subsp. piscicida]TJZ82502.1 hypothetical protein FA893_18015 [Photobacterium damselae subsp. piscicida]BBC42316.1 hypothetical protein PDPE_1-03157 [Photobacterium damselae subsp. piscicida]